MRRLIVAVLTICIARTGSAAPPATAPSTAPATAPARPASPLPREEVDRFIRPLVDGGWCTGLAVAVVTEEGTQVYGYGRVSEADAREPGGDTVYEIGSVSKVFTGLLLAQMVRDGQVALDDPAQKYLPDSVTLPRRNDKTITLQHLATHTSGLPRMPGNFRPKDANNPYADYTVEHMYAFLAECKPARDPGGLYEYSNLGAGLLGHALARRAGKSYEELMVERICEPLGMRDTRIVLPDGLRRRLAPGHDADGNPVANWDIPTFAGAGAIRSTADDMAKFVAAQVGLTKVGDGFAAAAAEAARARPAPVGPGTAMGLGWHIDTKNNFPWHNGQTGGYHSYVGISPAHRCGVVVLTNTGTGVVDAVGAGLLRRLTGQAAEPLKRPAVVAVDAKVLDRYVGRYFLGLGAILTVTRDGERLFAQLTGQPRFRIWPTSESQFLPKVVDARIDFVTADDGRVTKLVLHQNGKDVTGWRMTAEPPATAPAGADGR